MSLIHYLKSNDRYERATGAVVCALLSVGLLCGMLACMLAYFDVLTK